MRLLLDSHIFLWWLTDDRRLSDHARSAIATSDAVHVSAATAWEIGIKKALGRLEFPFSVTEQAMLEGFRPLAIDFRHADLAATLPAHHADPFDRMLVAQAIAEELVLVTADKIIPAYDVALLRT